MQFVYQTIQELINKQQQLIYQWRIHELDVKSFWTLFLQTRFTILLHTYIYTWSLLMHFFNSFGVVSSSKTKSRCRILEIPMRPSYYFCTPDSQLIGWSDIHILLILMKAHFLTLCIRSSWILSLHWRCLFQGQSYSKYLNPFYLTPVLNCRLWV